MESAEFFYPDVEMLSWRKSSRSDAGNDQCIEAAFAEACAVVRDTKARDAGMLMLSSMSWKALLQAVR